MQQCENEVKSNPKILNIVRNNNERTINLYEMFFMFLLFS